MSEKARAEKKKAENRGTASVRGKKMQSVGKNAQIKLNP